MALTNGSFKTEPLHHQVREVMRCRIEAGEFKKSLPNEGDLARELGVSAGTMRKALDGLEADGVLIRIQGRGTFVREHVEWADLSAEAKAIIAVLGVSIRDGHSLQPNLDSAAPMVVAVDSDGCVLNELPGYTARDFRIFAIGAGEIAAWLERAARLATDGQEAA